MRVLALALGIALLLVPPVTAAPSGVKLLVRDGNRLTLAGRETTAAGPYRPLGFSGDGRLYSIGGKILGGIPTKLPTRWLAWAPTGERAAYVTTQGGVVEWTPKGRRFLEPNGWGARWYWSPSVAWSRDGALAVERGSEVWVLRGGTARRVASAARWDIPVPFAWAGTRVLWWDWPDSSSIAADGVALYDGTEQLGVTLMYPDYAAVCGTQIAFVQGGDRESMDNKKIVFDGRDVSRDPTHSWASPACTPGGRLVASASRNLIPTNESKTHRSIWQLLPVRRQLTHAPWGWSDEDPRLLPGGSLLFVRSRITSVRGGSSWLDTERGRVMVLSHGKLSQVAEIGYSSVDELKTYLGPSYGHWDWSQFLAVRP